ncbi:NADH:ubiquinone oxidoreductase [Nowakowskiella sp. JEL0407]|nr:NADH:ubiquinone oxidoreductase [Nowakowskiella sp. JEL0407]
MSSCENCEKLELELNDARADLADYKKESSLYELETEKKLSDVSKRNGALLSELEEWKTKYQLKVADDNKTINALQSQVQALIKKDEENRHKIRDLEIQSDELERKCRVQEVSVTDLSTKYHNALEKSIILEQELEYTESKFAEDNQRLRDELKDTIIELSIMKSREELRSRKRVPSEASISEDSDTVMPVNATITSESTHLESDSTALASPDMQRQSSLPKPTRKVSMETLNNLSALLLRAKALESKLSATRATVFESPSRLPQNSRQSSASAVRSPAFSSSSRINTNMDRSPSTPKGPPKVGRTLRTSLPNSHMDIDPPSFKNRPPRQSLSTLELEKTKNSVI